MRRKPCARLAQLVTLCKEHLVSEKKREAHVLTLRNREGRDTLSADAGAAAVEFALVLVLFLTLVFGVIQYGYYFLQANSAETAAREGARAAAVGVTDCPSWRAIVSNRGTNARIPQTSVGSTFSGATAVGNNLTVTVTWSPVKFLFPFVPFISSTTLTETAVTRTEYVGAVPSC